MEISQIAIARLYVLAVVVGIGLGALYDVFRISRVFFGVRYSRWGETLQARVHLPFISPPKKHKKNPFLATIIFFEDLLFGILSGIAMILLFYLENNGKIRFPALLCATGGFFLYRATLGRLVMLCSDMIAFCMSVFVRYTVFLVSFPFCLIGKKAYFVSGKAIKSCQYHALKKRRYRNTTRLRRQMEQDACGMIPKKDDTKPKTLKRGHRYARKNEKAIQFEHVDEDFSRGDRCGLFDRVCK